MYIPQFWVGAILGALFGVLTMITIAILMTEEEE